jgi:hypothetical protein
MFDMLVSELAEAKPFRAEVVDSQQHMMQVTRRRMGTTPARQRVCGFFGGRRQAMPGQVSQI